MTQEPRILFIDLPEFKPLPPGDALRILAHGAAIEMASSIDAAKFLLKNNHPYKIVVSNAPDADILDLAKQVDSCSTVLVTSLAIPDFSRSLQGREDILLDHVVANYERAGWTHHQLRICLQKILTDNIFGIDKYLTHGTAIQRYAITGSADRETLNAAVMKFAQQCGLGQHLSKMLFGISEELLMNTIYDAPLASGTRDPQLFDRNGPVVLASHEQGELSFGCDGQIFILGASDPFGALKKTTFFSYLKKVMKRGDTQSLIDTKKEGAGLGFFKMLYSCHALICDVKPLQKTEVIALVDLREQVRDFSLLARSIHFFGR